MGIMYLLQVQDQCPALNFHFPVTEWSTQQLGNNNQNCVHCLGIKYNLLSTAISFTFLKSNLFEQDNHYIIIYDSSWSNFHCNSKTKKRQGNVCSKRFDQCNPNGEFNHIFFKQLIGRFNLTISIMEKPEGSFDTD